MRVWEYRCENVKPAKIASFLGCGERATSWELITAIEVTGTVTLIFKRPVKPPHGYTVSTDDKLIIERSENDPG